MTSREELIMQSEAKVLHGQLENHAEQFRAIRKGMEEGKMRGKRQIYRRSIFTAVAVVMAATLLVIGTYRVPASPQASQAMQPSQADIWGELFPFSTEQSNITESVEYALKHKYVQHLDVTAKQDGYQITVNAVIADKNQLILLYTATADSTREIYGLSDLKLTNVSTGERIDSRSWSAYGSNPQHNTSTYYGIRQIELERNIGLPERVNADFQIGAVPAGMMEDWNHSDMSIVKFSPRLKVAFAVDSKFWEHDTRVFFPDESIKIDGHEFKFKIEMTPLTTVITHLMDGELLTDKQFKKSFVVNNHYRFELFKRSGKSNFERALGSSYGDWTDEGFETVLDSPYLLNEPQALRLKFPELPGEPQLTIDLTSK